MEAQIPVILFKITEEEIILVILSQIQKNQILVPTMVPNCA